MLRVMSALVVASAIWFAVLTTVMTRNFDFRAFYCGGSAVLQRADPYRTQPLHSCEQNKTDSAYAAFARETVLPAPQPPYVLALFAGFAILPFAIAAKLWSALLLLCAAGAIVLVARIAKAPLGVTAAALWLSLCVTSIYLGELIPVFVCALAASAYFAQRGAWNAAGLCAGVTLAEPHLGVAVCASMALWAPPARKAVAIVLAAMGAATLAATNASAAIEYVQRTLPLHALSELASDAQLSAAVIAHAAGASDVTALHAGSISFVLASGLGICIAPVLARMYRDGAFLVLTPAAFSLIGGVFLHVTELAAAIPFTLLLLRYAPERRAVTAAALVLLAVPWFALTTPMLLGTIPGCTLAAITVMFLTRWSGASAGVAMAAALVSGFGAYGLAHAYQLGTAGLAGPPFPAISSIYPQASWAAYTAKYASSSLWPAWILRACSWAAMAMLATNACACVANGRARALTAQAGAKLRV